MRSDSREQITIVRASGRLASSFARKSRAPGSAIASSVFSNTNVEECVRTRQAASATPTRSADEACPSPSMMSL